MDDLTAAMSAARVTASISSSSTIQTPMIRSCAFLVPSWAMSLVYHSPPRTAKTLDLKVPWRPLKDERGVDLAAGFPDPCDTGDHPARTYSADVRTVFGAEVIDKPSIETWLSVPVNLVEIIHHRMIGVALGHGLNGVPGGVERNHDAVMLQPYLGLAIVSIAPETPLRDLLPGS